MELTQRVVTDAESFEAFKALLKSTGLPTDDLRLGKHVMVCYYDDETLVGTGGLEIYGDYALIRSISVKMGARGLSLGSFIISDLLDQAREKKLKAIYLLTESAHGFFLKKGFKDISREDVPAVVKGSSEFSNVCSPSAACMYYAF